MVAEAIDFFRTVEQKSAKAFDPKRGTTVLKSMANLPDQGTFGQAQQIRSALLDEARHPDNLISDQAQGWIKRLSGQADDVMMDAAGRAPGLESSFRSANTHWENLQNDFNSPRSPLYQALKEPIPEKVPQKFLNKGMTGGSPTTIDMLQRYGVDTGPLKRELLLDLADRDFKIQGKSLGGYEDEFLQRLFSPDELDHVYKTGQLGRSIAKDTNPSGTGRVKEHAEQVWNPWKLGVSSASAGATNSPTLNSWAMRGWPAAALAGDVGRGAVAMRMTQGQRENQKP